eukprot:XP_001693579.1 predicted protein [Chlamydomonas reinhardtii]
MALGALCEHALDVITAENTPEGMCAFCLTSVELAPPAAGQGASAGGGGGGGDGGGAEGGREGLVRLECFHAFHRECYSSWWLWRQAALREQEAALVAHTGASAASVLRRRRSVRGVEVAAAVMVMVAGVTVFGVGEAVAAAAAAAVEADGVMVGLWDNLATACHRRREATQRRCTRVFL